jgi:hypothetical protein
MCGLVEDSSQALVEQQRSKEPDHEAEKQQLQGRLVGSPWSQDAASIAQRKTRGAEDTAC